VQKHKHHHTITKSTYYYLKFANEIEIKIERFNFDLKPCTIPFYGIQTQNII